MSSLQKRFLLDAINSELLTAVAGSPGVKGARTACCPPSCRSVDWFGSVSELIILMDIDCMHAVDAYGGV